MCRIFGFRSILKSGVHRSLIDSENAIIQQSDRHPDGWGVAYYHMGSPHLVKNENQARECKIFEKLSGVVSSNTVVTHIRKSTVGEVGPLNTHPFQYGPWVFVHNGNVQNFAEKKAKLKEVIHPFLWRYILGETDSEALFFLFLTLLEKRGVLRDSPKAYDFAPLLVEFVESFQNLFGELSVSSGDYDKNYLTFLVTNGQEMYAFHGGQPLFFSTHKKQCSERNSCSYYKPNCETMAFHGDQVHHLLISSEPIKNENEWTQLQFGEYVGVDPNFLLKRGQLSL